MGFTPSVCPYCSCGCGILLQTRGGRLIGTHPGVHHPSSQGSLCMRGWNAVGAPMHNDRLTKPLVREKGQLVPVSVKKALNVIAQKMDGLCAKGGSSVLFCIGTTCANEDAYAIKKLARDLRPEYAAPTWPAFRPRATRFGRSSAEGICPAASIALPTPIWFGSSAPTRRPAPRWHRGWFGLCNGAPRPSSSTFSPLQ